ncbi:NACHT and WD repeat domain-containing protein 1 [Cricetulus griseus]|uniref:NACHT and WD repeat domain-containing protein 1 n=1 Tax=Cricetulus griseus TaxID=10029 RepID=G3H4G2_CRIGR|nr:NACHT and WD repeat domain-containing protein 1 [Cricetulus griseus]
MNWISCRGISGSIEDLLDDFDMCAPHMDSPEVSLVREALQLCRPAVELRGMGECPGLTGGCALHCSLETSETLSSQGTVKLIFTNLHLHLSVIYSSAHPSTQPSVYPSTHLPINPPTFHSFLIHPPTRPPIHPFVCLLLYPPTVSLSCLTPQPLLQY